MAENVLLNADGNDLRRVFQSGPILLDIPGQIADLSGDNVSEEAPHYALFTSGSLDFHSVPWSPDRGRLPTNPPQQFMQFAPGT